MIMRVRARTDTQVSSWLCPGKEYVVIGLSHDHFRVLNERGEPTLFERTQFEVLDESVPPDWVWERYADGEFYADPPGLHERGFWEDYFDGKEYARRRAGEYLDKVGVVVPTPRKALPQPDSEGV